MKVFFFVVADLNLLGFAFFQKLLFKPSVDESQKHDPVQKYIKTKKKIMQLEGTFFLKSTLLANVTSTLPANKVTFREGSGVGSTVIKSNLSCKVTFKLL